MDEFDVVVVGARCAGAPLATLLARAGLTVCVLDKARFPSDTASTHVVQPRGVAVLNRLGVRDAAFAAGAVPVERLTLVNDDVRLSGSRAGDGGLSMRRLTFDALLVEAAAAAGADVRTGCAVTGLVETGGRVAGARTGTGDVRARLVIGADGCRSTVARLVGAAEYHVAPPGRVITWGYFGGVPDRDPHLRIARIGESAYLACPTDGDLFMAGVGVPMGTAKEFLADRERRFGETLRGWPELAGLLDGAIRDGPLRTVPDWHGYFRTSAGPGWALVGDAGHFKDPTPAQGMADALCQAERLATEVVTGLAGGGLDARLRDWWRWRDEDCFEMHWFAADIGAGVATTPLVTEVLRTLAEEPDGGEALARVLNRELRPSELFTGRRIACAFGRAARRGVRELPALLRETAIAGRAEVDRVRARRRPLDQQGRTGVWLPSGPVDHGKGNVADC